jgi:erythronate-4-phosphate dehydrogenase
MYGKIDTDLMAEAFIATSHIAGYSADGKANGTAMTVNTLCKYFDLNLKYWYPKDVPPPSYPDITINCSGKSDEEIIREAVFHTYNIASDDQRLRLSPSDFEKQRGDYPLRREFNSYRVNLKKGTLKVREIIEKIGFTVI